jgi:hypothetical protein
MTPESEQLNAACDEGKAQHLGAVVRAYRDAVSAAPLAGCPKLGTAFPRFQKLARFL